MTSTSMIYNAHISINTVLILVVLLHFNALHLSLSIPPNQQMAYYSKGHNIDDDGDDFDDYDPTPYGGGYDIHITYGHPLPASDDICHPPSQNYSDEAAEYTSYAHVSGYDNDDAINNEYSSYATYGSAGRKTRVDEEEEEQQEVVDESERTEFEEPSEGYGRSEEDEYGGRNKYDGGENYGYQENEENEQHRPTYYDD